MPKSHSILDRVGIDRATAEAMVKDALKGPTTARCIWNTSPPRASPSTTAA
jgi:hypothetical protein